MQMHNKPLKASLLIHRFLFVLISMAFSLVAMAKDAARKVDVDIDADTDSGGFFTAPWVWVVGIAIFILLLVALLRGGSSRRDV